MGVAPRHGQHDLPGSPAGWSPMATSLIFSVRWVGGEGGGDHGVLPGLLGVRGGGDLPSSPECHRPEQRTAAHRAHLAGPRTPLPGWRQCGGAQRFHGQSVTAPIPDPWPVRRCSDPRPGELHTPPASWVLFRCRQRGCHRTGSVRAVSEGLRQTSRTVGTRRQGATLGSSMACASPALGLTQCSPLGLRETRWVDARTDG